MCLPVWLLSVALSVASRLASRLGSACKWRAAGPGVSLSHMIVDSLRHDGSLSAVNLPGGIDSA